jgi:hypothetical protein
MLIGERQSRTLQSRNMYIYLSKICQSRISQPRTCQLSRRTPTKRTNYKKCSYKTFGIQSASTSCYMYQLQNVFRYKTCEHFMYIPFHTYSMYTENSMYIRIMICALFHIKVAVTTDFPLPTSYINNFSSIIDYSQVCFRICRDISLQKKTIQTREDFCDTI